MTRVVRAGALLLALCVSSPAQAQSVVLESDIGLPEGAYGWRIYGYGDFNRDGKTDLVWKRWDHSGEARVWLLDGPQLLSDTGLTRGDNGWRVIGVGDFDGDGNADLAWRRANDTGEVRVWLMNGTTLLGDYGLPPSPGGYNVVGLGDFNGDGKTDLVWQGSDMPGNPIKMRVWLLDGGTLAQDIPLQPLPSAVAKTNWKVSGVADFNGDGKADLLLRLDSGWYSDTEAPRVWLMDGGTMIGEMWVSWDPARDLLSQDKYDREARKWRIVGVGDFNRDGMPDIVWQINRMPGLAHLTTISLLSRDAKTSTEITLPVGDPGWHVIGTGDFNGDGVTDLAWRRENETGEVREWLLNWR